MRKLAAKTLKAFATALFAASLSLCASHARVFAEKAAGANASAHAQYRARVRGAAEALEELAAFCEKLSRNEKPEVWMHDSSTPDIAQELPARQKAALERARTLLPPKERVESADGSVEVDNFWLHSALDEYAKLGDNDKRAASLRSVVQRLRALESRLAELEDG